MRLLPPFRPMFLKRPMVPRALKSRSIGSPTLGSSTLVLDSEKLLLDFDFGQHANLQVGQIESYLELAHRHTKQIFMDLISDKYLPVLRGENT